MCSVDHLPMGDDCIDRVHPASLEDDHEDIPGWFLAGDIIAPAAYMEIGDRF